MNNQLRIFTKLNQSHDLHKAYLSIVVIYLFCDDFVAANNHYNKYCEYVHNRTNTCAHLGLKPVSAPRVL